MTAVISIKVAEPQFEGQTKTKLGNNEVRGAVNQAVGEALTYYLEEHPKEAKHDCRQGDPGCNRRVSPHARHANLYNAKRRWPAVDCPVNWPTAPARTRKNANCSSSRVTRQVVQPSKAVTVPFQAILPLRGKILNVEKAMWHKAFESDEVNNIIQALGIRFGVDGEDSKEANIDKLRYKKIIIMTDADVDGSHIDTLIMTLFFRYMPQVIQQGCLYIATPPLYLLHQRQGERVLLDRPAAPGSSSTIMATERKTQSTPSDTKVWVK